MFTLIDIHTGEEINIYGVAEDSHGYPKFLIRKDNLWIWISAKHFIPQGEVIVNTQ